MNKILLALRTIENIHVFVLDYLGFLHRDVDYRIRNRGISVISRGGTSDSKEIVVVLSGYEYGLDMLPALGSPVIFDIGAHIGTFSLFAFDFYKHTDPKIFIFEPEKENFEYLCKNLKLNGIDSSRYVLYKCAIGDYEGVGYLDKSKQNDAYTLSPTTLGGDEELTEVMTLRTVAEKENVVNIDILKLDVEGYEYSLLGHEETFEFIKNRVSFILMEHHHMDAERNVLWIKNVFRNYFEILFEREDVICFENMTLKENEHTPLV